MRASGFSATRNLSVAPFSQEEPIYRKQSRFMHGQHPDQMLRNATTWSLWKCDLIVGSAAVEGRAKVRTSCKDVSLVKWSVVDVYATATCWAEVVCSAIKLSSAHVASPSCAASNAPWRPTWPPIFLPFRSLFWFKLKGQQNKWWMWRHVCSRGACRQWRVTQ